MGDVKVFKVARGSWFFVSGGLLFSLGALFIVSSLLTFLTDIIVGSGWFGAGLFFLSFGWRVWSKDPVEIRLIDNGTLVLKTVLGKTTMQVTDITAIRENGHVELDSDERLVITHHHGELLLPWFRRTPDFISAIAQLNPTVRVESLDGDSKW